MADGVRRRGPVWRMRRWWAGAGCAARCGALLLGVLGIVFVFGLLGGALEACDAGGTDPDPAPSRSGEPGRQTDPDGEPAESASAAASSEPAAESPGVPERPTAEVGVSGGPTVTATATIEVTETRTRTRDETTAPAPDDDASEVYYENCDAARDAGAAPVHAGEPGYGSHLDRDGDGVGCEPYAGP